MDTELSGFILRSLLVVGMFLVMVIGIMIDKKRSDR